MTQFDFGHNWAEYSDNAATGERIAQARRDFSRLVDGIPLQGRSFLDIGFGQGLGLLSAVSMGAQALGCDINPKCAEVVVRNQGRFPELAGQKIDLVIGSILDDTLVAKLCSNPCHTAGGFDIVHSWGVLHHTGDMRRAIANAASLVRPGGHFIIAIYNRHWSSRLWLAMKWTYCKSPRLIQKLMVAVLYPVIWTAKLLITGKNPKDKDRGMDFFYDVVDWVGGYPYEYGSLREIEALVRSLGFALVRATPAKVPTGCNEFVFVKRAGTPT